ncbi:glycosyltransferase family 4 protein [Leptothoe kymatousa]|uniref:Glycosyltransferase family 4 protein n=1 Tax=Leptothoe kymatousa TAU-MAC 1615 TaxID=2364775 RepID=A0ABS5Y4G5_9CYAN|nr:glycosyltransferase family 4 protein [Leptothoe kymatousa]MBT9312511.1 glycosyltransferase family 4 protein [Leptothoe kymatousa TAU-MAC 1615]
MSSCRSLVIVQVPPYPPTGGVALRNWQTLNLLKRRGDVAVFSIYKGADHASQQLQQRGFTPGYHYNIASPNRSWLEKVKNRFGYLRPDGYRYSDWLYTVDAAKALGQLVKTFRPNLVVFEELWLYPYLKTVQRAMGAHSCSVILDNHNVEGDKEDYRLHPRTLAQIRYIEAQFVRRTDQTWVCSGLDRQILQRLYGCEGNNIQVLPNGVEAAFYQQSVLETRQPHQLLFLGKFSYQPNADAAQILIQEIYPQLKQQFSDTHLWLVGRDPTAAMTRAAAADSHIHVTGMVPDVRPYLNRASAMVVPLYEGGGTRLKILEAFASHCPVVSTAKGAEGLAVEDNHHLLMGNTSKEIVEKTVYLWQNESIIRQVVKNAHGLFLQTYSWDAVASSLSAAIDSLGDT